VLNHDHTRKKPDRTPGSAERKIGMAEEMNLNNEQLRIVQELVAGKEITLAHIIGAPDPIIYVKLGLNPNIDYRSSAIGIMNITPPESVVIASDIAVKSGNVYLGFADRFTGTLIITGELAAVTTAIQDVVKYYNGTLGYVTCPVTKR
jgi:ethanolamine utilization protein EutS